MIFMSRLSAFTKYRAKRISIVFPTILPKGKLSCKHSKSNSRSYSTRLSPVKLAYTSYEPTVGNGTESSKVTNAVPPIIIAHGLFGSKKNWISLSKSISQRTNRKVIAVDIRNHGESPHTSEFSYSLMAEDVVLLMKDLGIEKGVLIGHSMGARVMIYVALNYPQVVEKLLPIDMSPISISSKIKTITNLFNVMKNVTLPKNVTFSEAYTIADEQLSASIKTAVIRKHLLDNLVEAAVPGKYKWSLNLPAIEKHFCSLDIMPTHIDKKFDEPTLFVGGGHSDHIIADDHEKIKQLFSAAKIEYIPETSHWLHLEKQQEFLDLIVPFINDTN